MLDAEDCARSGEEMIWLAGSAEGGAPYGVSAESWRRMLRTEESAAGWRRARDVLDMLLRLPSPNAARVEMGRVVRVGEGLFREVYAADVEVVPDANRLTGSWVVLLPSDDASELQPTQGCSRELQVLAALQRCQPLPFRTPRPLGALPVSRGTAVAREYLRWATRPTTSPS